MLAVKHSGKSTLSEEKWLFWEQAALAGEVANVCFDVV